MLIGIGVIIEPLDRRSGDVGGIKIKKEISCAYLEGTVSTFFFFSCLSQEVGRLCPSSSQDGHLHLRDHPLAGFLIITTSHEEGERREEKLAGTNVRLLLKRGT